MDGTSLNLK